MKKSLLVVPAMGVLLLAAAGSVGGTVAWFSSNSSAEIQASTFQATIIDGDLSVAVSSGKGTVASGNTVTVGAFGDFAEGHARGDVGLTHASYDHINGTLYTISSEETLGIRNVTSVSNWEAKTGSHAGTGEQAGTTFEDKVYWAVSWKMVFSYTFASESKVGLFFDNAAQGGSTVVSNANNKPTSPAPALDTLKSFRIAFVGTTTSSETTSGSNVNARVWAPNQAANKCAYIDATAAQTAYTTATTNETAYTYPTTGTSYNGDLINSGTTASRPAQGQAVSDHTLDLYQLGVFSATSSGESPSSVATAKLDITAVAWFEGTDENTVNAAFLDSVVANMKFYTREYTAA